MESLEIIAADIRNAGKRSLTLDAGILGEESADLLRLLWPRAAPFSIDECQLSDARSGSLAIHGKSQNVLSSGPVSVHFYLWDTDASGKPLDPRICLMLIEAPIEGWVSSYMEDYLVSIDGYLDQVAGFPGSTCLFSSIDGEKWPEAEYPAQCEDKHPRAGVRRGLNLGIDLDRNFRNLLRDFFVTDPFSVPAQGVIFGALDRGADAKQRGKLVITSAHAVTGGKIGNFTFRFTGVEAHLRLVSGESSSPEVILRGNVSVGERSPLEASLALDLFSHTVTARLEKWLKLHDLLGALPALTDSGDFGQQLLDRLGNVTLEELFVAFAWAHDGTAPLGPEGSLLAVGLSLNSSTSIPLIPGFLEIAPAASVRIDHPLSPTLRAWTATLSGKCTLGPLEVDGWLMLPDGTFLAEADLKMSKLLACPQLGLGSIDFFKQLEHSEIKLTLSGDVPASVVHGRLEIKDDPAQQGRELPALDHHGTRWHFTSVAIELTYDGTVAEDKLSYRVEGEVRLGDERSPYKLVAQGGYARGWFFNASSQDSFDVSRLVHDLLGHVLPADLPTGFELGGLHIAADFSANTLSLRGHTAHPWTISTKPQLTFNLEIFEFDKTPQGISTRILASVEVAGVSLRLLAEKQPDAKDAGWHFAGGTGRDREINLGKFATQFGVTDFPESLGRLSITNAAISYNTGSGQLTFETEVSWKTGPDLAATLNGLAALELAIPNTTKISGTFGPSEKKLTIELGYDGGKRLVFLYDARAAKENSAVMLAAYSNPDGQPLAIRKLVSSLSADAAKPIPESLSLTLKNILFAREQLGTDAARYLFGIEIEGGFDLSEVRLPDLPFIANESLPARQTLKLSSLQLLGAKGAFSRDDISALNALATTGLKLPARDLDGSVDLSAILEIGGEAKPLALPAGERKRADADQGAAARADKPGNAPPQTDVVASDGTRWLSIQRSFGPVHLERVGLAFKDGTIRGLLDAGLDIGGLSISLSGLTVSSPLTKLQPTFDLRGLGVDYRNGPLEIGGAFLKQMITPQEGAPYTAFSGLAIVRTESLSLSAIGSFANVGKDPPHPSLLIYAVLNYPIGGPPFFFVTGLAAGFGYNRALNMPTLEALPAFPLIEEATRAGGPPPVPASHKQQQETLTAELGKLEQYIPPAVGQNFLAVGIRFTSFKTVESFALLAVKFGGKLEFDLLGLSTLQSPPATDGVTPTPIARAQLALKATYVPDDGFLGVQAQLTRDSYVLSNACHLSGGFAFFSWFKDSADRKAQAGEFVLSLGGYHPKYAAPDHYPRPPRLTLNWQVSKPTDSYELGIKGDAYFALTPHAVMAGGHLEALWRSGNIRAWFNTGADFLINWKPYHYDARAYVDIGASYTFELFGTRTITIDVGADLHIWGPEFAGVAELHCSIFSVTVHFGDAAERLKPIGWNEFRTSFLPADNQICSVTIQGGLIREIHDDAAPAAGKPAPRARWIINPRDLRLVVESVIPLTELAPFLPASDKLSIAPMGLAAAVSSKHTVSVAHNGNDVTSHFRFDAISKSMPAALWAAPQLEDGYLKAPDTKPAATLVKKIGGYEIRPSVSPDNPAGVASLRVADIGHLSGDRHDAYRWESASTAALHGDLAWDAADRDVQDGMTSTVARQRNDLLEELGLTAAAMLSFRRSAKDGVMGLSKTHRD